MLICAGRSVLVSTATMSGIATRSPSILNCIQADIYSEFSRRPEIEHDIISAVALDLETARRLHRSALAPEKPGLFLSVAAIAYRTLVAFAAAGAKLPTYRLPTVFFVRLPGRVSSDKPRLNAFCRVAFSVLFKVRAILAADFFLRARAFNLRRCSALHARLFVRLLTIWRPRKSERPLCVAAATCQRAQDQFAVILALADRPEIKLLKITEHAAALIWIKARLSKRLSAAKKNPKQSYALGVAELLPQLRLLCGRRGVGGWGAARLAYKHGNKSPPRGYNAKRFYRKIRRPYRIWCRRDASL